MKELAVASQRTISHFLFHQGILASLFLKIKLKGHHFDTTKATESKSQAVLNTLTKQDFQGAFKNGRNAGNGTYMRKGAT
jgi:hypothetical protein